MKNMKNISGKFRRKVYFAQVSNIALRDENLSLKAKGLYSLIQSYITLESFDLYKSFLLSKCKEGEKAFESGWNELKNSGYLKQYKIRIKEINDDGKVLINNFIYEYELLDEPNLIQPALTTIGLNGEIILKNEVNIVVPQNGGCTKNEEEIVDPQKVDGTSCGGFKNGVSNNTYATNTYSLNQSINQDEISLANDPIDEIDYEKVISENIDLENLKTTCPIEIVDGIFDLIIDTLHSTKKSLVINKENIPIDRIKNRLLKLNFRHINYVINRLENIEDSIEKPDSYILTCLYNASKTIGVFYTNQANQIEKNIRNNS